MTVTLTGFYPWTDQSGHATTDLDYRVTNYHSQTSSLPSSMTGVTQYTFREIRLHYRQPNGVLTGSNAYLEGIIPDSMDWDDYYPTGANQAHVYLRDGHGIKVSGLVMDGGWDGVRTSSARSTIVEDCAFIKMRDDVIEYDSSLNDIPNTHIFRRNLVVGYLQGISSRPGDSLDPMPGNQIIIQDSIFVAQQWFNGSWNPGILLKRRNDTNGNPLPHTLTNCVVAYDKAPSQSEPSSYVALSADTVTGCTFVWLGTGSVPTKFGLANNPGGWTVISGTGTKNHLGVTGTSALDWLENYITAWLNVSGTARLNLRTTIRNKVNFNTVLSGSDRHILLPGLQAKVAGASPTMTAPFDFPAGPWAIGVFTRLNDNSGSLYQYLLSIKHPTANFPQLNLYLFEAQNTTPDANGDPGGNKWAFNIFDNSGTTTGARTDQSGFISNPTDSTQRLLVLQNTGSAIELWACVPGDVARRLINHTIALGALTFSGLGTSLQFGRRYDGNTGRYYEEEAGGLFKIDSALTQGQIQDIASGDHPEDVVPTTIRAVFPFLEGPVSHEFDEISGELAATRVGSFASSDAVGAITSRSPTLYISGADGLTDSSSHGRTVTQQGGTVSSGELMSRGSGMRLNGAHLRVDNPASSSFFAVDTGALDLDVQCEFGAGMDCIIPVGVLTDNLVLMSMDNDENAHRHGWVIWAHSDGSVELQVRQPWQPARMRSRGSVIAAGTQFHIQMVLGRDGMMLYLNGRRLEDGIKNSLVWHGLDRRERNTQSRNTSHFRVGATGTSGNSDIIVGHIFAFVRSGHANELLDADCQAIAGEGGAPYAHRKWGVSSDSVGPGTNVIQAKIDGLTGTGGRLFLSAGTYTQSVNLNLKSNVEIVGVGSGSDSANNSIINLTNNSQIATSPGTITNFSALTGDIGAAAKTLTATSHGLNADSVLVIMGNQGFHQLYTVDGEIPNASEMCSELMPVEQSVNANSFRIDRKPQFAYPASQRQVVGRFSPITDVGLRNLRIQRTHSGAGTDAQKNTAVCNPRGIRRFRLSNVDIRENYTGAQPTCFLPYGCVDLWTDPESPCTFRNVGAFIAAPWQPYCFQANMCRGVSIHSATLHGGQWHAIDIVSQNVLAGSEWPVSGISSSNFVISGQIYVVGCIVTGGVGTGGTANRLNAHGGVKHYRFFNCTMPNGGGFGFGGGYGDLVDIQASAGQEEPHMSHTYGAWRNYVFKCNHLDTRAATGWFYPYTQANAKASMRDCVFSNVTKINSGSNNTGGTNAFANNTVRGCTGPFPSVGMGGNATAPPDPMT